MKRAEMRESGRSVALFAAGAMMMVLLSAKPAHSAGGVGHYYIAKASAARIMQSSDVPKEVKEALKDPSCLNAFCNGAIAPDLSCIVEQSHYGRTTRLPNRMLDIAEEAYAAASRLPNDDPSRQGKIKEALKAICFTCGWLSHCATDVAVHPKVNSRAGDAWEYCSTGKKGVHMSAEIQLSRYLAATVKKPGDKIAFDVPYWLVAKAANVTEKELQESVKGMRTKMAGEIFAMGQVTISLAELQKEWQNLVQKSINDTVRYVSNPGAFRDYGLDYGPISTDDFRELRKECIAINDGKVPEKWGAEYMNWWEIVKSMTLTARHDKLIELIKGKQISYGGKLIVRTACSVPADFYVNGVKMQPYQDNVIGMPSNNVLKIQVCVDTGYRSRCIRGGEYRGSNVKVLEQSPYRLHYTSIFNRQPYEYDVSLLSESYTWKVYYGTGKVFSSGVHKNVRDDVFMWTVPSVNSLPSGKKTMLGVYCNAAMDWSVYKSNEGRKTESFKNVAVGLDIRIAD